MVIYEARESICIAIYIGGFKSTSNRWLFCVLFSNFSERRRFPVSC
jgi:hypothetical protein